MATPSDNLDPKEATEAKLCAYLEGELPASERAEIEQHLAANPQHRKLLADLAKTRDWMRLLPQESAPVDLAESFQGQVERSMLLEDPEGRSMTIVRWPQIAMMAAIILLTVGLGVTLVIILKGPANRNVAISSPAMAPVQKDAVAPATQQSAQVQSVEAAAAAPTTNARDLPGAMVPLAVAAPSTPAPTAPPVVADAAPVLRKDASVDDIKSQLISAGYRPIGDVKSICFVVQSDTPTSTIDQLQGFFSRHQLVLEQPAELQSRMLATAGQRPYSNLEQTNRQQIATNAAPPSETQVAQSGANDAAQVQAQSTKAAPSINAAQQTKPSVAAGNEFLTGGTRANTTQPVAIAPGDGRGGGAVTGGAGTFNGTVALETAHGSTADADRPVTGAMSGMKFAPQLYVAHNVSPLQVELLDASLAANNPGSVVRRLTLSPGPVTSMGLIAKGQTLIITVPQLVGPGMDKTNAVKVNEDGTITLPMLDALPAAGATMDELQQRIVTRYHDANLIPNATVSIATPPSTQPALVSGALPTTMPMGIIPATNPVVAATQPASGIDVVVILEKADPAEKAR